MNRLQFLRLAIAVMLGMAAVPLTAHADDYPNRPIRLIAPYPPGGTTDIVARYVANGLQKSLGWTVVVENRAGAGGIVGHEAVAKAQPDGYTLVLGNSAMLAVSVSLFPKLPYNPTKDFTPITEAAAGALVLVVKPSLPVKSLQDLLALAKKEPGKLNAGLSALGSMHHMTTEIIKARAGVKWTNVPYKGSAPMLIDLLSGQTDFAFDNIPSALPHIKDGKLRAIAVTGPTRSDLLPNVPTLEESGMKGRRSARLAWRACAGEYAEADHHPPAR
jgi:tripartite-type tricarboxylate transporter receptor subunit TctC